MAEQFPGPDQAPADRPTAAPPTQPGKGPRRPNLIGLDFDKTPVTIAWEMTHACTLACVHCRASAIPRRDPRELTTIEGFRLIDQVVEIGRPILVFTGGDPLMRPDIYALISYAVERQLTTALSPSATGRVTRNALQRFQKLGLDMVHVSLDGSEPGIHDHFRGVRGSYARTIQILRWTNEIQLPLQVGTTVSRHNLADLPKIAARVAELGATVWSVFFLVPTGRGAQLDLLSAEEHEQVYQWLYQWSKQAPYHVRTTAGQPYRRVVIQAEQTARGSEPRWELTGAGYNMRHGPLPVSKGVNDGSGFCFVDHIGNVCPSGFLQLPAGNLREQSLLEIYRESPLFRALRDPAQLKGKCGVCPYRQVCGGSRARAYGLTGDYLASDPTCAFMPSAVASASAD